MKTILIVANKYPNKVDHNINIFTQQTAWTFAELGFNCIVICPMPVNFNIKYIQFPYKEIEQTENGSYVTVYRPKYLSAGQRKGVAQKQRVAFTTCVFTAAVESIIKKFDKKPDVLFGEFLCPAGVTVAYLGKKYNIPAYFQHGEATYVDDKKYGNKKLANKLLVGLSGVIAVSSQNKGYLVDAGIVPVEKIGVFPNGCKSSRFYRRDRIEARRKFGWDEYLFIVGFCGSFDDRKGIMRLQEAVDGLDDVYFACAGKGSLKPNSDKCILAEPIDNVELPWFMSAIDAFVLPTYHEGCCTAIVEAICCGCPIISSDRAFNYEICDDSNSILVEPSDIDAIRAAIFKVKEDSNFRKRLSEGSLAKAPMLALEQRIENIVEFMGMEKNK